MLKKIAILFSGNGSNMEQIIKTLHGKTHNKLQVEVVLAICNKPNAYGLERLKKYPIKTLVINHKDYKKKEDFDEQLVKNIKQSGADLSVLAGFMRILTPVFTNSLEAVNIHPSILPLFKGANAIQESYNSGMLLGGVSVHMVTNELDSGRLVAQKTFAKHPKMSLEDFENKIHKIEHEIYPKAILKILKNQVTKSNI